MKLLRTFAVFIIFSFASLTCKGQSSYILHFKCDKSLPVRLQKLNHQSMDSTTIESVILHQIGSIKNQGYLMANLDGLIYKKDSVIANVFIGQHYKKIRLSNGNVDSKVLLANSKINKNKPQLFTNEELERLLLSIKDYYQNSGHPFVSIRLDSIVAMDGQISANLLLNQGPLITYDSIDYGSFRGIKYRFLAHQLGFKYDFEFNNSEVLRISEKIDALAYLKLSEKEEIDFKLGKGQLKLELESVRVNTFDGIAGFVPRQNGAGSQLTGEVKMSFDNMFKSGKKIEFEWQKLNQNSQFLDASYFHPSLFYSPINFAFNYNQIKEDTLFSNRVFDLEFEYKASKKISISTAYSNVNGNNIDASNLQAGDFDINKYSVGIALKNIDRLKMPRNGFTVESRFSIGSKTLNKSGLDPSRNNQTNQYEIVSLAKIYKQLSKLSTLHIKLKAGIIRNDQLFLNDLFRIGGLNTLRGFNEKLFFASEYGLLNLEWQYLMSDGSYFLTFIDQAILSHDIQKIRFSENPTGVGVGLRIKAKSGFFNLIYGLGQTSDQNFSFNFSKLHFGYSAIL